MAKRWKPRPFALSFLADPESGFRTGTGHQKVNLRGSIWVNLVEQRRNRRSHLCGHPTCRSLDVTCGTLSLTCSRIAQKPGGVLGHWIAKLSQPPMETRISDSLWPVSQASDKESEAFYTDFESLSSCSEAVHRAHHCCQSEEPVRSVGRLQESLPAVLFYLAHSPLPTSSQLSRRLLN